MTRPERTAVLKLLNTARAEGFSISHNIFRQSFSGKPTQNVVSRNVKFKNIDASLIAQISKFSGQVLIPNHCIYKLCIILIKEVITSSTLGYISSIPKTHSLLVISYDDSTNFTFIELNLALKYLILGDNIIDS
jgi:hypothetical protein